MSNLSLKPRTDGLPYRGRLGTMEMNAIKHKGKEYVSAFSHPTGCLYFDICSASAVTYYCCLCFDVGYDTRQQSNKMHIIIILLKIMRNQEFA